MVLPGSSTLLRPRRWKPQPWLAELRPALGQTLLEALHLATGIDDALLPGEERVAHGAHLGLELGHGRSGAEGVSAQAVDDRVGVPDGRDVGLHGSGIISKLNSAQTQRQLAGITPSEVGPGRSGYCPGP